MRRWFWLSAFVAGLAQAEPRALTLDVRGMSCASCPITVRIALQKVPGVAEAKVDLAAGTARVRYDDTKADPARIAKAATDAGFPSTVRQP